jgi:phosphate-selective porin OprO/OprP
VSHVGSLHLRFDSGTFGFRSDLSGGIGYGSQSDLIGLALVPFYHLGEHFQVVGRYTYVKSFGDNGVRFARYESRIEPERGDLYNEFFIGLNWFLYGHKFKVQTGIKYTMMDGVGPEKGEYRGWGWTTGLRMSW